MITADHRAAGRKVSDEQVREIRALAAQGLTIQQIWRRYDLREEAIRRIVRGETWKHLLDEFGTADVR